MLNSIPALNRLHHCKGPGEGRRGEGRGGEGRGGEGRGGEGRGGEGRGGEGRGGEGRGGEGGVDYIFFIYLLSDIHSYQQLPHCPETSHGMCEHM